MSSSLIRGKYVITRTLNSGHSEVLTDGAVFQREGVVVDVGPYELLRHRHAADEVIGSPDDLVMPGLVNSHHHVGLTPFQLGTPDLPLEVWMPQRFGIRDVDPYLDTLYSAMDMLEHGITSVVHMWIPRPTRLEVDPLGIVQKHASAYEDIGMRATLAHMARDQNHFVYGDDEAFLAQLPPDLADAIAVVDRGFRELEDYRALMLAASNWYDTTSTRGLVTFTVVPMGVQWCSDELLVGLADMARTRGFGCHIHVQETIYQKLYGLRTYGTTPLGHLDALGVLGPGVTAGHGVWLTDADIDILARTSAGVCHCPSSNLRIRSGIAPLQKFIDSGIPLALGLDEAGLNDDRDMFQEMRLAQRLQGGAGLATVVPSSHAILAMATARGAGAGLMAPPLGTIEPGMRADLILLDLDHVLKPYLDPDTDIVDALLYRARGCDVHTVIVDGQVVLRDRVFTSVDKSAVLAEIAGQMARPLRNDEIVRREAAGRLRHQAREFYGGWHLADGLGRPHQQYNSA